MAAEEKTEEPTARKIEKAKAEGDVPVSQEVKSLFCIFAALLIVSFLIQPIFINIGEILAVFIENIPQFIAEQSIYFAVTDLFKSTILMILPILFLFYIAAFLSNIMQFGFLFSGGKIEPKLSRLSFAKGVKKIVSKNQMVELLKGISKLVMIIAAVYFFVVPLIDDFHKYAQMSFNYTLYEIKNLVITLLITILAIFAPIAILDWIWNYNQHRNKLRMTKQEIKDEMKQNEGDPQVAQKLKQLRRQRSKQRIVSTVPEADVIITNPTHYSVALKYDMDTMAAPKVIAKGVDDLAARIRKIAKTNNIPIIENAPLARSMYAKVEVDENILPEHYEAVAKIISHVMQLKAA